MSQESVLTPVQIFNLLMAEQKKHSDGNLWGVVKGTAIVYRESRGNPKARRDASQNSAGGNDRGLWQWNDKWNPEISDTDAYDPVKATEWAYKKSNGFTDFGPWKGASITPDTLRIAVKAAVDAGYSAAGLFKITEPIPVSASDPVKGGTIGDTPWYEDVGVAVADGVASVKDKLFGWAEALGTLLSALIDPSWWKRIGVGVLGVAVVIGALVLMFGQSVNDAVNPLEG